MNPLKKVFEYAFGAETLPQIKVERKEKKKDATAN